MADKVLCKTYLKEALGCREGANLMLLVSSELKNKADALVRELDLELRVEPCERFQTGYWVVF